MPAKASKRAGDLGVVRERQRAEEAAPKLWAGVLDEALRNAWKADLSVAAEAPSHPPRWVVVPKLPLHDQ